jgi:hypothetical protein
VGGFFIGSIMLDSTVLTSPSGNADSVVARYSSAGELQWAIQTGGNGYNACYGLGVDAEDRVYSAGWFRSHNAFGGIMVTNKLSGRDGYIARIDPPPSCASQTAAAMWSFHGRRKRRTFPRKLRSLSGQPIGWRFRIPERQ